MLYPRQHTENYSNRLATPPPTLNRSEFLVNLNYRRNRIIDVMHQSIWSQVDRTSSNIESLYVHVYCVQNL